MWRGPLLVWSGAVHVHMNVESYRGTWNIKCGTVLEIILTLCFFLYLYGLVHHLTVIHS